MKRIGGRQKTITYVIALAAAAGCAALSARWMINKYEYVKYHLPDNPSRIEGIQDSNNQGFSQLSSVKKINASFWDDFSDDEMNGLVIFVAIICALTGFCIVWLASFAVVLIIKT